MIDLKKQNETLEGLLEMQRLNEKTVAQMASLFPDGNAIKASCDGKKRIFLVGALWISLMDTRTVLEELVTSIKYPQGRH